MNDSTDSNHSVMALDDEQKHALLNRFSTYLDELDGTSLTDTGEQTDLFSLFVELAALKNEVKLESRQVKTALDEFKDVFGLLRNSHEQLTIDLERGRSERKDQRRILVRPLLLELVDLQDRLQAGLQVIRNHRGSWFAWLHKRETRLIQAIAEAQEISLRRLQHFLATQHVSAIDSLGQALDPHTMKVVEIVHHADLDNGVVVEELRQGFNWEDDLLRPAEVKVNKQSDNP